jgi:hypothetical protein
MNDCMHAAARFVIGFGQIDCGRIRWRVAVVRRRHFGVARTPRSAISARRNSRINTPGRRSKPRPDPVHLQGRTPLIALLVHRVDCQDAHFNFASLSSFDARRSPANSKSFAARIERRRPILPCLAQLQGICHFICECLPNAPRARHVLSKVEKMPSARAPAPRRLRPDAFRPVILRAARSAAKASNA